MFQHRPQVSHVTRNQAICAQTSNVASARQTWRPPPSEMGRAALPTCSMQCPNCTTETPRSLVSWAHRHSPLLAQHPTLPHSRSPRPKKVLIWQRTTRRPMHPRRSTSSRRPLRLPSSTRSGSRPPSESLLLRDLFMKSSWTAFTPTQTLSGYAYNTSSDIHGIHHATVLSSSHTLHTLTGVS